MDKVKCLITSSFSNGDILDSVKNILCISDDDKNNNDNFKYYYTYDYIMLIVVTTRNPF